MLFSSISFLYYFFPIVLAVYFLMPMRQGSLVARNMTLLAASIFFYAWGEPIYVLLMLVQAFSGWFFGMLIHRYQDRPGQKRAALIGAILVAGLCLGYFKYADFFVESFCTLFGLNTVALRIALPIGISFYTFQILSYDIDLYRGNATLQKNVFTFATYVTLFPQLIAGPIVRYVDISAQLTKREHTLANFAYGVRRFVFGLSKKVLLANTLGELVQIYKSEDDRSVLFAWLSLCAYALQLYFDFSGYSDMAIGIGRMFGFRFKENFNYPYIARSATDFWRRWHISMSGWFRDYIYIPLGGNRVRPLRHITNILFVWILTGLWHGAGWTFIFWGLYYAIVLIAEKYLWGNLLSKAPAFLAHLYTFFIFLIGWAFFDADGISTAFEEIARLFGQSGTGEFVGEEAMYYLRSYAVLLLVAILGATPIPARLARKFSERKPTMGILCEAGILLALLFVVTGHFVDGSFNPFIYFRF
ncbi:MAG: MBOAT family protein [Clostridiales Family XIII bacterium]|jgi:alginate O-acetyltransferase complex protein AlgI|nr:MBOAT family protein [Clostridiales Family XIII bacterium]